MTTASFSTCDFCDAHKGDEPGGLRVLPPLFQSYGGVTTFAGPVVTVKCFEDNTQVKALLDTPGQGRVLVVVIGCAPGRRCSGRVSNVFVG